MYDNLFIRGLYVYSLYDDEHNWFALHLNLLLCKFPTATAHLPYHNRYSHWLLRILLVHQFAEMVPKPLTFNCMQMAKSSSACSLNAFCCICI